MSNYEQYLNFNTLEDKLNQEKIIPKIVIPFDVANKITGISEKKVLKIFAEPFCPDCRALVAIVERFIKLNKNIEVEYIKKDKLKYIAEEDVIPTVFLIEDDIKQTLILSEFPKEIKYTMTDQIKYDYRTGKYNDLIIQTLLNALIKEN